MADADGARGAVVSLWPLTLRGAGVRRRGRTLVGPVDLSVAGGGVTAVIGPNGSGKTTLLRMMHGLERVTGEVAWAVPEEDARRRQAYVSQRAVVLRRSVRANLGYPLRLRGLRNAAVRHAVERQAEKFGLTALLDQPAPSLSGGELQRLALARALIAGPDALFADEPCAALDGAATREVETRLIEAALGTTVILATHDMGQARRMADGIVFLLRGRVHETGDAATFFDRPATPEARAFLRGDIVE